MTLLHCSDAGSASLEFIAHSCESHHKLITGTHPAVSVLPDGVTFSAYAQPSGVRDERFTLRTSPEGKSSEVESQR